MQLQLHTGGRVAALEIADDGAGYAVLVDGHPLTVQLLDAAGDRLELAVDGRRRRAWLAQDGDAVHVFLDGRAYVFRRHDGDAGEAEETAAGGPHVRAPMPGKVVKLLAAPGDAIAKGQGLLILEAMKMESEIAAPLAGRVLAVHVEVGQIVGLDAPLVDLEPEAQG